MVRRINRVLSSVDARRMADFVMILRKLDKEFKAAKGKKRMKSKDKKARPSTCSALPRRRIKLCRAQRRARSPTWLGRGPFLIYLLEIIV